jgi:hypothetical protein
MTLRTRLTEKLEIEHPIIVCPDGNCCGRSQKLGGVVILAERQNLAVSAVCQQNA